MDDSQQRNPQIVQKRDEILTGSKNIKRNIPQLQIQNKKLIEIN